MSAQADMWRSNILSHCYDLDDIQYQEHFFIRVFWSEVGGGQLYTETHGSGLPQGLNDLNEQPSKCMINGREIVFETVDYRTPTTQGACGLCEQSGFRVTVDGYVAWEVAKPEHLGDPIFSGTIDMDKDMLRVCEESRPEVLGVKIPFEQDFFDARTSIVICKTITYR